MSLAGIDVGSSGTDRKHDGTGDLVLTGTPSQPFSGKALENYWLRAGQLMRR